MGHASLGGRTWGAGAGATTAAERIRPSCCWRCPLPFTLSALPPRPPTRRGRPPTHPIAAVATRTSPAAAGAASLPCPSPDAAVLAGKTLWLAGAPSHRRLAGSFHSPLCPPTPALRGCVLTALSPLVGRGPRRELRAGQPSMYVPPPSTHASTHDSTPPRRPPFPPQLLGECRGGAAARERRVGEGGGWRDGRGRSSGGRQRGGGRGGSEYDEYDDPTHSRPSFRCPARPLMSRPRGAVCCAATTGGRHKAAAAVTQGARVRGTASPHRRPAQAHARRRPPVVGCALPLPHHRPPLTPPPKRRRRPLPPLPPPPPPCTAPLSLPTCRAPTRPRKHTAIPSLRGEATPTPPPPVGRRRALSRGAWPPTGCCCRRTSLLGGGRGPPPSPCRPPP